MQNADNNIFDKIDLILRNLSKYYSINNLTEYEEIIVNSKYAIEPDLYGEHWNGEDYFIHQLILKVNENLYWKIFDLKSDFQDKIKNDISHFVNEISSNDSFVINIKLDEETYSEHWREESATLLKYGSKKISVSVLTRLWGENSKYRVFLSHKSEEKVNVSKIQERLSLFGISSFVAHKDIEPTEEWQREIENALFSMDYFVAVMSEKFHDSNWTDQEIGIAIGRNVPIASLRLGCNPYGFIGKYQGISCSWDNAAFEIMKILIKKEEVKELYITAIGNSSNYDSSLSLFELFQHVDSLNEAQINRLVEAHNENSQVYGCYSFNGKYPMNYGNGILPFLNKISNKQYIYRGNKIIEENDL